MSDTHTLDGPQHAPPAEPQPACGCCGGTRRVLDIVGEPRPCSRCGPTEDFDDWYAARLAAEREDRP